MGGPSSVLTFMTHLIPFILVCELNIGSSLTPFADLWAEEKPCLWALMQWVGLERHSWVSEGPHGGIGVRWCWQQACGGPAALSLCLPWAVGRTLPVNIRVSRNSFSGKTQQFLL